MAQKVLTVGELIELALKQTQVAEAAGWIGELRQNGGQARLFAPAIFQESIMDVCYGISSKVVGAPANSNDGLESRGHDFLREVTALAVEHGISVDIRKTDKIETLKSVLKPI